MLNFLIFQIYIWIREFVLIVLLWKLKLNAEILLYYYNLLDFEYQTETKILIIQEF